ncbi:AAA domain-containing protein [Chitinophaga sp. YIM B06452]|uniref:AAA domain-containing protein n=1 Tax=Chitinophaga sp. YIM B06452 TaxID=3082158 RepID=UPI0031FEBD7E
MTTISFRQFLQTAFQHGAYSTDDVIAAVLPLFRTVQALHDAALVAPFGDENALQVQTRTITINTTAAHPELDAADRIDALFNSYNPHFEVVDKVKLLADQPEALNLRVHHDIHQPLHHAAYVPGYRSYEMLLGHHDEQTDIFCLGLVLTSVALGIDLYEPAGLDQLVAQRQHPLRYKQLHPAIGTLITEMTELNRAHRTRDLQEAIHRLEHYRDFDPEKQLDLAQVAGWVTHDRSERQTFILNKLRNRLFDVSRRNRLLFYKPNTRFANLTISSVPMVLHHQSIRPELLFTWNPEIAEKITGMKDLSLNKYLRFEDHPYLPGILNKIRLEARKDVQEYGFSQLKLVVAFLKWHNLPEDPEETIFSPLLLIPVELKKKKQVGGDQYVLSITDNNAEVNPVLANQLRELYGIELPDLVDLEEMSLEQFYQLLQMQVEGANRGIVLQHMQKPRIKLIYKEAKDTVQQYQKKQPETQAAAERKLSRPVPSPVAERKPGEAERPLPEGAGTIPGDAALFIDDGAEAPFAEGAAETPEQVDEGSSMPGMPAETPEQKTESTSVPDAQTETSQEQVIAENAEPLTPTVERKSPRTSTAEDHELFQLAEAAHNPYRWEFDSCHVVLGNFNYKKMSLVRDYNSAIDQPQQHVVFDQLFSAQPRPVQEDTPAPALPEEWYHVIQADPTQARAIMQARNGESYIIQGPPGTGKSQTITNLIADFVARGKQVLFVCEKRAALDVVYHRLKQQGLDELCSYIHDSQADKRSFIRDLKLTYESNLRPGADQHSINVKRNALLHTLRTQLERLQEFHDTHAREEEQAGIAVRALIERLLALKDLVRPLSPVEEETVPHYRQWLQSGNMVEQLGEALEESGAEPVFALHPLSRVHEKIFAAEQPITQLQQQTAQSLAMLEKVTGFAETFDELKQLVLQATLLLPLAESNNLRLLDDHNPEAIAFEKELAHLRVLQQEADRAAAQNTGWRNKFSEQDTAQAISIATRHEQSFWRFLSGAWRRLKSRMQESYDLSQHAVQPAFSLLLQQLQEEYAAARNLAQARKAVQQQYRIDNIELTWLSIERLRMKLHEPSLQYLLQHEKAQQLVMQLAGLQETLHRLDLQLQQTLQDPPSQHFRELRDLLESIQLNAPALEELLPALGNYLDMPGALKQALRSLPFTPAEMEAGMAHKTLRQFYQFNKSFANTGSQAVEQTVETIRHCYHELLQLNAQYIRINVGQRFREHVQLSNRALAQVPEEQQEFAKQYAEGRKILENEFSKSMRYKSIRELCSRGSGLVLRDLKPVWLMSPLSVSDSFPLDQPFFDAVIFDEASQITLEEGVPALYRAPQTIIVGDDRQMPPTDFFSARSGDPDDLERNDEEDEILSADADSLLTQGARKMNSLMLGWHYRSHSETLISYSNHAFYGAGLLTIPDRSIHTTEKPAISVQQPSDALFNVNALFDRSISYHHLPNGTYAKRGNSAEAAYIAHLVRELLFKNTKESIGIVAFSQEQQHCIETALEALCANDKRFDELLEDATERTDEGQFTGLFVKNLENVQGDERDIIIMSVCYAPDHRGKMSMHFGPINKKGGEKRLNVIFSRARQHMAIVSSIRHHQITNVYNAGANYLRRFLQYAENVSTGNMAAARNILDSLATGKTPQRYRTGGTVILKEIREQLEKLGLEVTEQVGQSGFRCSLAVKADAKDKSFSLGIQVDDEDWYRHENVLEQYYQRPAVLESFGWQVLTVYAKDWLQQPQKVMEDILRRLGKPQQAAPLNAIIPQDAVPAGTTRLLQGEGKTEKFWEAAVSGSKLFIRQGKTGTKGQIQVKTCIDAADAEKEKEKLVEEKKNSGWKVAGEEASPGQPELF